MGLAARRVGSGDRLGADFWRETHHSFTRHSGHVLAREVDGGVTATVRVRVRLESLYDQAGLMVLVDEETWIKTGVKRADGEVLLGNVLTLGRSDRSARAFHGDSSDFWGRATLDAGCSASRYPQVGCDGRWSGCAPFRWRPAIRWGQCAARRNESGWMLFSDFSVARPQHKALHDLS